MDVSIIREDRFVAVNGEALFFDFTLPDNIWAIQWSGAKGEIEFNDTSPNEEITDFSDYQYLVDAHATEKQRIADEQEIAEDTILASRTYVNDRLDSYPSMGDQFDMMYHDAVDGTTTWQDTIQSVKIKFPK
jgi:hypothetical protein